MMRRFNRRAEWVWRCRGFGKPEFGPVTPPYAEEMNRYIYFRKVLEIEGQVDEAPVHVSADGRYQLFVNGSLVGRGPARCNPAWQYIDPYDLAPYLRPGRNVIAALVHSYGRPTSWYELPLWEPARVFGCGGFFLQGDVVSVGGAVRLDTGDSWRHLGSEAWQRDAPVGNLGFVEIYDARRAPVDWMEAEFDDSTWEPAEVLRVPGDNFSGDVVPFPVLVPRDIPGLFEEVRFPRAVLSYGEVVSAPEAPEIARQLARERIGELEQCQIKEVEALLAHDGAAEIITTEDRGVSVVADFGEIVTGYVRLDLEGPAGAVVDFAYGERLEADGRVHIDTGIPGFDVRPTLQAHRYTLREGTQDWERFEWSGFRYLQITFRRCSRPLRVRSISVNFTAYPVEDRGQFACSDDLLNRIWQAGANTLRLCMHDGYEDCPSREQRQWVGDAYVQTLVNYAAFGDPYLAAKLMRQVAQSQRSDGMTMMSTPGDFSASNFSNIPDFCLYWILGLGRYVEYTGDSAIVGELYPSVVKAIGWFERHLNEEDLLTDVPHGVLLDWAELDKMGQVTALNAQFVAAVRVVAELARILGIPHDSERYEALADQMAAAINAHLWDEERGVYVDARRDEVRSRRISQQANAAAIAFDVAPRERWSRIFSAILDDDRLVLARRSSMDTVVPFDEERDVVLAQPFYSHHLHRALSKAGWQAAILDNIRRRWGRMVESGESTFWETWQLGVISSKCHAWASTPTYDLSTEVLGVAPITPGFRRFRVAPHPVDLEWARGVFPSPHGDIAIAWQWVEDRFELSVEVPDGTEAEVLLPEREGQIWRQVEVDGRLAAEGGLTVGPGTHQIAAR